MMNLSLNVPASPFFLITNLLPPQSHQLDLQRTVDRPSASHNAGNPPNPPLRYMRTGFPEIELYQVGRAASQVRQSCKREGKEDLAADKTDKTSEPSFVCALMPPLPSTHGFDEICC